MNSMDEENLFFDLAMKAVARQATDSETKQLDALVTANPRLKAELDRLRADVQLAKAAMPLVDALQAKGAELPGYVRQRLRAKVKQTLGQQKQEQLAEEKAKAFAWSWRWLLGLAATAAVVALIAVPSLMAPKMQIEVALLDFAGPTRGAGTNEAGMFLERLSEAGVTNISSPNDLKSWEQAWPANKRGYVVKVLYDRASAEIRVMGKGRGREFARHFSVGGDPREALDQVQAYIKQETAK